MARRKKSKNLGKDLGQLFLHVFLQLQSTFQTRLHLKTAFTNK